MEWTRQQDAALKAAGAWIKNPRSKPFFYLAGYAGTGKTTLAKHLASTAVGEVLFGAFTGKAAHVLRSKGCEGASTIHSMIYVPKGQCVVRLRDLEKQLAAHMSGDDMLYDDDLFALEESIREERLKVAQPSFARNDDAPAKGANLLILDECSMINDTIGNDILSFGVPVLVLGDPAQLPPVKGGGFFTNTTPDVVLTDIQRQARENPIIDMATRVREGKSLDLGDYGESRVVSRADRHEALMAGQILVGRNATRQRYNSHVRQCLGRTELLEPGDKIVCLRNNHEVGVLNGSVWWVDTLVPGDDTLMLSIFNEDTALDVHAHRDTFRDGAVPPGAYFDRMDAEEFCHASALTVHKAQGSQWDDVLLVDESSVFRNDARKHLYTGITRAAKRITIVKGD